MTTQYLVESQNQKFPGTLIHKYFDNIEEAVNAYDAINGKATLYKIQNGHGKVFWKKDK
jgi:hypothetical protein